MAVEKINPGHPVTEVAAENAMYLLAVFMHKTGAKTIQITVEDMNKCAAAFRPGMPCLAVKAEGDVMTLYLVTEAEGRGMAQAERGMGN